MWPPDMAWSDVWASASAFAATNFMGGFVVSVVALGFVPVVARIVRRIFG